MWETTAATSSVRRGRIDQIPLRLGGTDGLSAGSDMLPVLYGAMLALWRVMNCGVSGKTGEEEEGKDNKNQLGPECWLHRC